jgi:hypothetical protein
MWRYKSLFQVYYEIAFESFVCEIWNGHWCCGRCVKLPGFNIHRNVLIVNPEHFNAVSSCVRVVVEGKGESDPVSLILCLCPRVCVSSALSDTCKFIQTFLIYNLIFQLFSVSILHKICNKISGDMLNVKVLAHRKFKENLYLVFWIVYF